MAKLTVRIGPNGQLDIKTTGVQGAGCMALTQNLRDNLCQSAQLSQTGEFCQVQEQRQDINLQSGG